MPDHPDASISAGFAWWPLGEVSGDRLTQARAQTHRAVQTLAAAADALLPHRDQDRHAALAWSPRHGAMLTADLGDGARLALRPADLTLLRLDPDGEPLAALALHGAGLDQAIDWAAQTLAIEGQPVKLRLRDNAGPDHPVRHGAPFDASDAGAFTELARWFANAHALLVELADAQPGGGPVRLRPAPFDMTTLVKLDDHASDAAGARVRLGFTPGDDEDPQPRFYASLHPALSVAISPESLPPLPDSAVWADDRQRIILPLGPHGQTDHLEREDDPARVIRRFFRASLEACHAAARSD